jgi:hypothetical protein
VNLINYQAAYTPATRTSLVILVLYCEELSEDERLNFKEFKCW